MAQVLQRRGGAVVPEVAGGPPRPRTTWGQDLVTALLSFWMVAGTAADSWAHVHQKPDTFFTPWHGIVYSGYVVLASWMVWLSRPTTAGVRLTRQVPVGYGLGLVGVLLMLLAGVGDGFWHTLLGIEANFEAVLSPSHLAGLVATVLMFSSPARAAWRSTTPGARPPLAAFLPTLLSLTAVIAMLAVFFGHAAAFQSPAGIQAVTSGAPVGTFDFYVVEQGFMDLQFTNLLLLSGLLLSLRRWRLPFGAATILIGVPTAIGVAIGGLAFAWVWLAALAGGLAADWAATRPGGRRRAHLLVATVTPAVLWSAYFLALQLRPGLTWSAELWSGSVVVAVLGGAALHLLVMPPPAPDPDPDPDPDGG